MTETRSNDDGTMARRQPQIRQAEGSSAQQSYDGPEPLLRPGEDLFADGSDPRDDRS